MALRTLSVPLLSCAHPATLGNNSVRQRKDRRKQCRIITCSVGPLQNFLEQRTILPVESIFQLIAYGVYRWELVAPFIGPGGVDDRARIEALSLSRNGWIKRPAPGPADDVDILRLGTGCHGPDRIIRVVDVNVIIHDDDITAEIGAGAALACDDGGLFGVARIGLLDLYNRKEAITCWMEPDTFDIGNAGVVQRVPYERRALDGTMKSLIGGRTKRRLAAENRMVSIVKSLHPHHRFRPRVAGVITWPLAEGTFPQIVAGRHFSFDRYFGVGRNWQARVWSTYQLYRLVEHAARVSELAHLHR